MSLLLFCAFLFYSFHISSHICFGQDTCGWSECVGLRYKSVYELWSGCVWQSFVLNNARAIFKAPGGCYAVANVRMRGCNVFVYVRRVVLYESNFHFWFNKAFIRFHVIAKLLFWLYIFLAFYHEFRWKHKLCAFMLAVVVLFLFPFLLLFGRWKFLRFVWSLIRSSADFHSSPVDFTKWPTLSRVGLGLVTIGSDSIGCSPLGLLHFCELHPSQNDNFNSHCVLN